MYTQELNVVHHRDYFGDLRLRWSVSVCVLALFWGEEAAEVERAARLGGTETVRR